MIKFSDHIPDEVFKNPNSVKFIRLLDELCVYKDSFVTSYANSFNYKTADSLLFLRKYIAELGDVPLIDFLPRKVLEDLVENAYVIHGLKGTKKGFVTLLESLSCGNVVVDDTYLIQLPDFLIFDDLRNGILKLSNEEDGEIITQDLEDYNEAVSDPKANDFYFLFEDNWDNGHGTIDIEIETPFHDSEVFKSYIQSISRAYLPAITSATEINITFNPL